MKQFCFILLLILSLFYSPLLSQTKSTDKPIKVKSLVFLKAYSGFSTAGAGAKYFGSFDIKDEPKLKGGFNIGLEKSLRFANGVLPRYASNDEAMFLLGAHIQYQINEKLFFQPDFSIVIGRQNVIKTYNVTSIKYMPNSNIPIVTNNVYDKSYIKYFGGVCMEQQLFYVPEPSKQLVLGASFYERFVTNDFYDVDLGLAIYLGLKF